MYNLGISIDLVLYHTEECSSFEELLNIQQVGQNSFQRNVNQGSPEPSVSNEKVLQNPF